MSKRKTRTAEAEKELMLSLWLEEFVRPLSGETVKILAELGNNKELDTRARILSAYVSFYIENIIYGALVSQEGAGLNPKDTYQKTAEEVGTLKHYVQLGVGSAFKRAFARYTGNANVDYYCQINPIPEPENNLKN